LETIVSDDPFGFLASDVLVLDFYVCVFLHFVIAILTSDALGFDVRVLPCFTLLSLKKCSY
jgi:hypothetical protein